MSLNGHLLRPGGTSPESSLLLFQKINCEAVSIEKDKYMTPAHSLKTTRSSHSAQYRRHKTYSDALKNPPHSYPYQGLIAQLSATATSAISSFKYSWFITNL